ARAHALAGAARASGDPRRAAGPRPRDAADRAGRGGARRGFTRGADPAPPRRGGRAAVLPPVRELALAAGVVRALPGAGGAERVRDLSPVRAVERGLDAGPAELS